MHVLNCRWLVIIFVFYTLNGSLLMAKESGNLGAGVILGDPTGPTLKFWLHPNTAINVGLGFTKDSLVYGDLLFHGWNVFSKPQKGKLAGYLGLGFRFEEKKKDDNYGLRTVAGIAYWFENYPVEIFLELVPVFQITPDINTGFDSGFGLRYYFASF